MTWKGKKLFVCSLLTMLTFTQFELSVDCKKYSTHGFCLKSQYTRLDGLGVEYFINFVCFKSALFYGLLFYRALQ